MRVVCLRRFLDSEANVTRDAGDVFEASPERVAGINGTRYGVLVEEVEERPAPRRRGRPRKE